MIKLMFTKRVKHVISILLVTILLHNIYISFYSKRNIQNTNYISKLHKRDLRPHNMNINSDGSINRDISHTKLNKTMLNKGDTLWKGINTILSENKSIKVDDPNKKKGAKQQKTWQNRNENYVNDNNNDNWIWLSITDATVVLRSLAYYDDRPLLSSTPCLRLYFLFSADLDDSFWKEIRFHYEDLTKDVEMKHFTLDDTHVQTWQIQGTGFMQHLITIPFHTVENFSPSLIKISSHLFDEAVIKVNYPREDNPVEFAVCLKPLYGTMSKSDISLFAEWFEMYKLFEVSEFYIYNSSFQMTPDLAKLLYHYDQDVTLIQFGNSHFFTKVVKNPREYFKLGILISRAAYVDCIYKNYKRVKYMLLVDQDEVIVPRQHGNYHSMINYLHKQSANYTNAASLSAQMAMFYKQFPNPGETLEMLKYQRRMFFNRTPFPGYEAGIKSFINTQTCILAFHHHCIMTDDIYPLWLNIPRKLALTQHYRTEMKEEETQDESSPDTNKFITDTIMNKYKNILQERKLNLMK